MMSPALILGNGPAPSQALFTALRGMTGALLCADGGAETAARYGAQPSAVVGDLDSVSDGLRARWPDADWVRVDADDTSTDLAKVLGYASEAGVMSAILAGFTGGRTDHTLWNLSLLPAWADRLDLCVVDDTCLMRLVGKRLSLELPEGTLLSLCPLAGRVDGITTQGLRWALRDEALIPGERDGISNEVTGTVEVRVTSSAPLLLACQWERIDESLLRAVTIDARP